jgi:hypothetical protein
MEYDEQVVDAIEYLREFAFSKIEKFKKLNEDLKLCKEIFPPDTSVLGTPWLDNEIRYSFFCRSMDDVKIVLKKFAASGVMLDEFINSDTNPIWYLKGKYGAKIRLSPSWSMAEEGANCRLMQVGEETRTFPVYKLVCKDKEEVVE